MNYYTDLFSPETFEAFNRSDRTVTGFRITQHATAQRVRPGDRFVCYVTKLSRWIGILEAVTEVRVEETPLFYPTDDPFTVRFTVKPVVWLPKERGIPIYEKAVWDALSFTKDVTANSSATWTGVVRRS